MNIVDKLHKRVACHPPSPTDQETATISEENVKLLHSVRRFFADKPMDYLLNKSDEDGDT